jgi:hypothetical protein
MAHRDEMLISEPSGERVLQSGDSVYAEHSATSAAHPVVGFRPRKETDDRRADERDRALTSATPKGES